MEGETDKRVIPYLMEAHGVTWPNEPSEYPVFIEAYGGVDEILKPGVVEGEIRASGLEALGVVVDADGDASARWEALRASCANEFTELPAQIPAEGLEVAHAGGPRFGIWIMPNNRFAGMLEDLLVQLIPDDSRDLYGVCPGVHRRVSTAGRSVQGGSRDEGTASYVARLAGSPGAAVPRCTAGARAGPHAAGVSSFRQVVQGSVRRVVVLKLATTWRRRTARTLQVEGPVQLDAFLRLLGPLLDAQGAQGAWVFGSRACGTASADSDIDVIVVAPTERPFVERFRDYLPAIANANVGVDLLVYTPAEFARMQAEGHPFLIDALADGEQFYVGCPDGG